MAKTPLRSALALVAGILITIGGCSDYQPAAPASVAQAGSYQKVQFQHGPSYDLQGSSDVSAEKVIGPEGGVLDLGSGNSITFPAGALATPMKIRGRTDNRYVMVDLGPTGLRFPDGREPTLVLSYANAIVPVPESLLTIIYTDEAGRFLEDMKGTVDPVQKTVTTKLHHFSKYAVASGN